MTSKQIEAPPIVFSNYLICKSRFDPNTLHIAAVVLPAVGGMLWMVDYRIPFIAGAAMSLVSLIAVQWIRTAPESEPAD